jgi:hypothetical protein
MAPRLTPLFAGLSGNAATHQPLDLVNPVLFERRLTRAVGGEANAPQAASRAVPRLER